MFKHTWWNSKFLEKFVAANSNQNFYGFQDFHPAKVRVDLRDVFKVFKLHLNSRRTCKSKTSICNANTMKHPLQVEQL
jgi:hypothetical protein